jgi:hypothetical protein
MNKKIFFLILSFCSGLFLLQAQTSGEAPVEMADDFYSEGKVYVVVVVVSLVVVGMMVYLFSLDKKLNKLEKEINNRKN